MTDLKCDICGHENISIPGIMYLDLFYNRFCPDCNQSYTSCSSCASTDTSDRCRSCRGWLFPKPNEIFNYKEI